MASRAIIDGLYNQIELGKVKSTSGKYFIQESRVREIMTPSVINRAVTELACTPPERLGLARKIQHDATVVFAILISMGKADYIVNFRNHECLDHRLPISEVLANEIVPEFGSSFTREFQWQFLPYVFELDMRDYHRDICEVGRIIPFVDPVETIAEGGFGEVTRVSIPTALQHFFDSKVRMIKYMCSIVT